MSDCPLVLVEWEDSAQPVPGWSFLRDFQDWRVVQCVSVGWLIQDGDSVKALAPNMGDVDSEDTIQAAGIIRIPARCITRIVRLREAGAIRAPSSHPAKGRTRKGT